MDFPFLGAYPVTLDMNTKSIQFVSFSLPLCYTDNCTERKITGAAVDEYQAIILIKSTQPLTQLRATAALNELLNMFKHPDDCNLQLEVFTLVPLFP